jgi:hypothetical protein
MQFQWCSLNSSVTNDFNKLFQWLTSKMTSYPSGEITIAPHRQWTHDLNKRFQWLMWILAENDTIIWNHWIGLLSQEIWANSSKSSSWNHLELASEGGRQARSCPCGSRPQIVRPGPNPVEGRHLIPGNLSGTPAGGSKADCGMPSRLPDDGRSACALPAPALRPQEN